MPMERPESTGHRDSGTVAVETAIVSLFLIVLLFGIVETAFLIKDWLSVSAAARAGARMGASEPRGSSFAQDSADQVTNAISGLDPANLTVWVYKTTSTTGQPPATCTSSVSPNNCVPFTWNGTQLITTASGNWLATTQNACAGDNNRDVLGVYVKYKHTSPLGFFFNNATVSESTVMWIEPSFALICKP